MLTKVRLEHYRSIEFLEIDLKELNIFVGNNGSGKSNLIDAISFIKDSVRFGLDRAISERHGIDSIIQWSRSKPFQMSVYVEFEEEEINGHYYITLSSSKKQFIVIREGGKYVSTEPFPLSLFDERLENFEKRYKHVAFQREKDGDLFINIQEDERQKDEEISEQLEKDQLFLTSAVTRYFGVHFLFRAMKHAISDFELYSIFPNVLRQPQKPSNDSRLNHDGSNLTSIFKYASRKGERSGLRKEVIDSLKLVMQNLETIQIQSIGGLMVPIFLVKERDGKVKVDPSVCTRGGLIEVNLRDVYPSL